MVNEKDIRNAFEEVITKEDEVIVLYSGISNFIWNSSKIAFKKSILEIKTKFSSTNK